MLAKVFPTGHTRRGAQSLCCHGSAIIHPGQSRGGGAAGKQYAVRAAMALNTLKCIAETAEGAQLSAQLPRLLARLVSASTRSPELLDRLGAAARSVPAVLAQLLGLLSPARRLLAAQQAVESTGSATATADAADLLVAGRGSGGSSSSSGAAAAPTLLLQPPAFDTPELLSQATPLLVA